MKNLITPDMTFGYTVFLAVLLLLAGIGAIVCIVYLFRIFRAAHVFDPYTEYYEADEYEYHGWEDPALIPVKVERRAAHERTRIPVERIDPEIMP